MTSWLIPCSPKDYDYENAFDELSDIDWRQSTNVEIGDIVYIYISSPISAIKYKGKVVKTNKPLMTIDDSKFYINQSSFTQNHKYMQLHLLTILNEEYFSFENLKKNSLIGNIQGPQKINETLQIYFDNYNKQSFTKPKVICCEVAWMKNYDGEEDNVSSGGEYVKQHGFGHEEINFRNDNGYYKGFVQSKNGKIKLNRIDPTVNGDELNDVLVVWCAKRPKGRKTIVGYYNHAKVYHNMQKRINSKYDGYYFEAKVEDSKLLPEEKRNFDFDDEKKGNPGQANVWYADALESKKQITRIIDYVNDLINQKEPQFEEIKDEKYIEGNQEKIFLTRRERNPKAREACIAKYGYVCQVCGLDMEKFYGPIAHEYIHVHHIHFISDTDGEHEINPNEDLITVCPNCHAMLHSKKLGNRYLSVEELKREIINAAHNNQIGKKLEHPNYGIGEIKNITENYYEVYFASKGIVKLGIDFINLKCKFIN